MGVWIETASVTAVTTSSTVTPCMGVWIETSYVKVLVFSLFVTPCMGVWIETAAQMIAQQMDIKSHPVWVCGLKHKTKPA